MIIESKIGKNSIKIFDLLRLVVSVLDHCNILHFLDEYVASITEIPRDESVIDRACWSRLTWLPKSIRDVLKTVFDVYTFTSVTYILLVISTSLTMLGKFDILLFVTMQSFT